MQDTTPAHGSGSELCRSGEIGKQHAPGGVCRAEPSLSERDVGADRAADQAMDSMYRKRLATLAPFLGRCA
jgi:hypothetical protein